MILSRTPLTLSEAKTYISNIEERPVLDEYFKKFAKLSDKDSKKLVEELTTLNNPKLNSEHIIRLVDFLPSDAEDLNKVLLDVSLSEEEMTSILSILKNY